MLLPILLCSTAAFFLFVQLATVVITWVRCRPARRLVEPGRVLPPVTVVRPLCGLETFSEQTIEASFALTYPRYELLFCVADAKDPIVPLVEAALARHPEAAARLLVGRDAIGFNPKLNNMVKGWREASHDWIAFIDSNVLVTPGFLAQVVSAFRDDTGAVSAPPCGLAPVGFGAHLECAFLNTYEARWQYAADTVGNGFAQGKTLFYRKADLDRSAMAELATEVAEDAATTKMVRRANLRIRLAPVSPQPLGIRPLADVWSRQLRWARMRRMTFPGHFMPEIVAGAVVPALVALAAAGAAGWPRTATLAAYLAVWYGAECSLGLACRWPMGWRMPFAIVGRDLLLPVLWVAGWTGSSFTWKGAALKADRQHRRRETA